MRGSVSDEVRSFLAADQGLRGELLERWRQYTDEGKLPATRLGRILCCLALERGGLDPAEVPAALEALQRMLPSRAAQLYLGAFCVAYFDDHGQALPRPHGALAGALLGLEDNVVAEVAFGVLRQMLNDAGASLPYAPGSKQPTKVSCSISPRTKTQPATLQDIRIDGQSVLVDSLVSHHPRRLAELLVEPGTHGCKASVLLGLLSREYLVPLPRLELTGAAAGDFLSWRPDAGLVPLDTNAPHGIGEFNDEDLT